MHLKGVPSILDVEPSVLALFGVAPGEPKDGKAFFP